MKIENGPVVAVLLAAGLMTPAMAQPPAAATPQQPAGAVPTDTDRMRLSYVLGPNDQILVRSPEVEELNEKAFRVDAEGNLFLPLVGAIKASGITVQQLEAEMVKQLSAFFRSPRVTVSIVQYRSDPVFFVGAFRSPGIYPLQGRRTLVEMLAVVGGLQPNASRQLRVTRRLDLGRIPLPNAAEDPERNVSTVDVSLTRLMETVNPEEDIELKPYDVIRVATEEMVYVTGEVARAGALPVTDKDSISMLQALVLSGGMTPSAAADKVRVLRPVLNSTRRAEIVVDVGAILAGQANDFPLFPNDIVRIPRGRSTKKTVTTFATYAIPALVTSLVTGLIFVSIYGTRSTTTTTTTR